MVGAKAELVTVEARFAGSVGERNEIVLTGLPDPVIRESKGRLVCALESNGLHLPKGRLFLNLVPAALRKSGEILDLPLLLAAAAACGHFDGALLRDRLFLGELGIDGRLHAVPGGLAAALAAQRAGIESVMAPGPTAGEAAWVPGVRAYGASHVEEVLAHLLSERGALVPIEPVALAPPRLDTATIDDVRGQATAKLAAAVAAAGGHGLLFVGPPGAGKSMLARRLRSLLPAPTLEERLEITRVLSVAGRWPGGLATQRPFRAPHHTVSYAGLVGGGSPPTAGEITLAHCGVLFLDELPEFRRETLEALRQPMEQGSITISRAGRSVELAARFQLVAAMNPCPCSYLGHPTLPCRCPPAHVQRYRARISGPLLDRIDLRVELAPPTLDELSPRGRGDPPPEVRAQALVERIGRAQRRQEARQGARRNAELDAAELDALVPLDRSLRPLVARAANARSLSARAVQSIRRVARTLADLDDDERCAPEHVARAIALRAAGV